MSLGVESVFERRQSLKVCRWCLDALRQLDTVSQSGHWFPDLKTVREIPRIAILKTRREISRILILKPSEKSPGSGS